MGTEPCLIASLDKDLDTIPGKHFNWVTTQLYEVSEREGYLNFYVQAVLGDKADNIPGYDGKMRPKIPQFLQPVIDRIYAATSPKEMYDVVYDLYENEGLGVDRFLMNCELLYILKSEGEFWHAPK